MKRIRYKLNEGPETTLSTYEYDELGALKTKRLHFNPKGGTYGQNVAYTYDIEGQLKSMTSPQLAMNYYYQTRKFGTAGYLDGSISDIDWTTKRQAAQPYLQFDYDRLGRLTSATGPAHFWYNERLSYDIQGNLKTLQRDWSGPTIDNLTYTYAGSGGLSNRLASITETGSASKGLKAGSFTYDANGNVKTNGTRGTTGTTLTYNYLNLIEKAQVSGQHDVTYTYDASGEIHSTKTTTPNARSVFYAGAAEYNASGFITRIATEEGMINGLGTASDSSKFRYWYYLADHLGNVRALLKDNGDTLQTIDYTALGVPITGTLKQQYGFNGKEYQPEQATFDYGWRQYDPWLGRWNGPDPANEFDSFSPYGYVLGDPVGLTDPDGAYLDTRPGPQPQGGFKLGGLGGWSVGSLLNNGIQGQFFSNTAPFINNAWQFTKGFGSGAWSGAKGTWNFFSHDAYQASTWKATGNFVGGLGVIAYSGNTGAGVMNMLNLDSKFGTNFANTTAGSVQKRS